MRRIISRLLVVAIALMSTSAIGQVVSDTIEKATCPNSHVFGEGIVTKVCWNCFFPMRIGGAANYATMPLGSAAPMCTCPGRLFGWPTIGPTLGIWMPGHMIELVRTPYCSVALGKQLTGSAASVMNRVKQGGPGGNPNGAGDQTQSYYNMHYFNFPVAQLLNQLTDSVCVSNAGADMDVLYFTEIDPTWNNDALALQVNRDAALYNTLPGIAACLVDAVSATAFQPLPYLFWCAGSWGTLYPPTGSIGSNSSPQQNASGAAAKGLLLMHQRGLGLLTYTDAAVCRDIPFPVLPKNQYKLQTVHPIAETLSNHWIGASTMRWGEWRHIPVVGEDFLYLVWNWQECCGNP